MKIVALLCKHGADPKITNKKFETPICIATKNKYTEIVELLAPETQQIILHRFDSESSRKVYQNKMRMISHDIQISTSMLVEDGSNQRELHSCDFSEFADDVLSPNTPSKSQPVPKPYQLPAKHKIASSTELPVFEDVLSNEERQNLNVTRIQRNNPFTRLKCERTKKVLQDIDNIAKHKERLPVLEAWIEKKSHSIAGVYQRRWVIVRGSYILWSDKLRVLRNPKSAKERKRFNNSINIMNIKNVTPVQDSKSQRKFTLIVGTSGIEGTHKEYLWKCATMEDRDYWVTGLRQHINHTKSVVAYLGTK